MPAFARFLLIRLCLAALAIAAPQVAAQSRPEAPAAAEPPLRVAVARLTHGHVRWILDRPDRGDVQLVAIYEPDRELAGRYAAEFKLDRKLFFDDLSALLDAVKPDAVVAFGSIREHLSVVEAAAPRGVHVMVEKPLAVSLDHALAIQALARRHGVHVLTNYETTWYPSTQAAYDVVHGDAAIGPIRKVVVHDGHQGPKEIGVGPEFLAWLTDPVQNGGGALVDFGCYGANLITWLMHGAEPMTVTAVTQQLKPDIYPRVDDEATVILTYPGAQGIIQASWNWPVARKDMEVYGRTGYVHAPNRSTLRLRTSATQPERVLSPGDRPAPLNDPFAYLAAVVRGKVTVADTDLSALANNVTVVRILDAAKRSAQTGRAVSLGGR